MNKWLHLQALGNFPFWGNQASDWGETKGISGACKGYTVFGKGWLALLGYRHSLHVVLN